MIDDVDRQVEGIEPVAASSVVAPSAVAPGVAVPRVVAPTKRRFFPASPLLRGLAQGAIGVGALAYVIAKSPSNQLAAALSSTRIVYLPLLFLAILVMYWLMAVRWRLILSVRDYQIRTRKLLLYYVIGTFFGNFVPGGSVSTDVVRLIYVDRDVRDKAFVLTTLVYDRFMGMFALLLTGLAATLASREYLPAGAATYLTEAVFAVTLVISAFLMSQQISARLSRFAVYGGGKLKLQRIGNALGRTLDAMAEIRSRKWILASTLLVSVLVRVFWTLAAYTVAVAMNLPVGLALIFAFVSVVDLVRQLPITPNGLGLREGALVVLFGRIGIDRGQALVFSFWIFAPLVLTAIIGGIVYTLSSRVAITRGK
ncbi:MAG TPA: lysylphosphatidylglycerol synthase transmembrane domain-containing protein [Blastocatellia bacterium]|nr:lysylphosphatidylglycerol synthase transmembrane domain-containing protein [Blastocatellia bacterium]